MIREMRTKIPEKRHASLWVPPGQKVTVGPYRIPDGMVYVDEVLEIDPGVLRQMLEREGIAP